MDIGQPPPPPSTTSTDSEAGSDKSYKSSTHLYIPSPHLRGLAPWKCQILHKNVTGTFLLMRKFSTTENC